MTERWSYVGFVTAPEGEAGTNTFETDALMLVVCRRGGEMRAHLWRKADAPESDDLELDALLLQFGLAESVENLSACDLVRERGADGCGVS